MDIKRCCYFWDLEFGFFTGSIITLVLKIFFGSCIVWAEIVSDSKGVHILSMLLFSWLIATVGMQLLALMGIIQKKSLLLQPYLVVLVLEVFFLVIVASIWYSFTYCFSYLLTGAVVVSIDIYSAMCIRTLYKKYLRQEENLHATIEEGIYHR